MLYVVCLWLLSWRARTPARTLHWSHTRTHKSKIVVLYKRTRKNSKFSKFLEYLLFKEGFCLFSHFHVGVCSLEKLACIDANLCSLVRTQSISVCTGHMNGANNLRHWIVRAHVWEIVNGNSDSSSSSGCGGGNIMTAAGVTTTTTTKSSSVSPFPATKTLRPFGHRP